MPIYQPLRNEDPSHRIRPAAVDDRIAPLEASFQLLYDTGRTMINGLEKVYDEGDQPSECRKESCNSNTMTLQLSNPYNIVHNEYANNAYGGILW